MNPMRYNRQKTSVSAELCDLKTVHRLHGGFTLDIANLPQGATLPAFAPIAVNYQTRMATALVRAKVIENGAGKKLKITKNPFLAKGMFLTNGTTTLEVVSVDTTSRDYDEITAKAEVTAFTKDSILAEAKASSGNEVKATAQFLTYDNTPITTGATITAVAQAYEVHEMKLPIPLTEADKASLTSRFLFV